MSNDLIQKNAELGKFLFCERYTLQPVKNALYIAEGQDLKRGAVVDVNGVLVGTNSLMPYAVLENDCDTRAKGAFASVFVKGEFNFDKLFFADGLSDEDLDNIVYNGSCIGIIIKPYNYSENFKPKSIVGIVNDGGSLEDSASINVFNNASMTLTTNQSSLTLNVNLEDNEVPNFAVEITATADCTLTVTSTNDLTVTTLRKSVAGGDSLETGKFYQVTCVGNCWTLAEFEVPTP